MKLTLGFFVLSVQLAFSLNTYAQSTSITLDVKACPIAEVLDIIERETDFQFFYNSKVVNVKEQVSVKAKSENVFTVLDQIFNNSEIQYRIIDKDIILTVAERTTKTQQTKSITGIVTDLNGEPIIGANVLQKGTLNGTITDIDGNFTLQVPESAVLHITYIGYLSQEVTVSNRNTFTIQLIEDTQRLEEVVIIGYGTQKKVNVTGSITSVKTEEINSIPSSNLSNSLAGRAPGVTITTSSGMAGGSSSIRMRGSFGEPLFVINNVIRDKAAFDALDPNEVENISFLKDAASASIYGSRAGNGVVLVTTKNGKVQKPEFQYKGSISTSRTTRPVQSYTATDELIWANRVAETLGQPQVYDPNGEFLTISETEITM